MLACFLTAALWQLSRQTWTCLEASSCCLLMEPIQITHGRTNTYTVHAECVTNLWAYRCTHTHTHTEPLREIYMSAWHCSNPWCQSSSTWALLSLARRQRPIYQALLPPPHVCRDTEEGSGRVDSSDHTWWTHWGNRVALGSWGKRNDEPRQRRKKDWWQKKERSKRQERGTRKARGSDKTLVVQILAVTMWESNPADALFGAAITRPFHRDAGPCWHNRITLFRFFTFFSCGGAGRHDKGEIRQCQTA